VSPPPPLADEDDPSTSYVPISHSAATPISPPSWSAPDMESEKVSSKPDGRFPRNRTPFSNVQLRGCKSVSMANNFVPDVSVERPLLLPCQSPFLPSIFLPALHNPPTYLWEPQRRLIQACPTRAKNRKYHSSRVDEHNHTGTSHQSAVTDKCCPI
jgi:hypothetical protein